MLVVLMVLVQLFFELSNDLFLLLAKIIGLLLIDSLEYIEFVLGLVVLALQIVVSFCEIRILMMLGSLFLKLIG